MNISNVITVRFRQFQIKEQDSINIFATNQFPTPFFSQKMEEPSGLASQPPSGPECFGAIVWCAFAQCCGRCTCLLDAGRQRSAVGHGGGGCRNRWGGVMRSHICWKMTTGHPKDDYVECRATLLYLTCVVMVGAMISFGVKGQAIPCSLRGELHSHTQQHSLPYLQFGQPLPPSGILRHLGDCLQKDVEILAYSRE